MLVQSYCSTAGIARPIREQCTLLCLFRLRDGAQRLKLLDEADLGLTPDQFDKIADYAWSKPYGFLTISFAPKNDGMRFRSGFNEIILSPQQHQKMRSGVLSNASVRKFCKTIHRDDSYTTMRFNPATTRSSRRVFRKTLAEGLYGPGVLMTPELHRTIFMMAMRALEEDTIVLEEAVAADLAESAVTGLAVTPTKPIKTDPFSTPLPGASGGFVRAPPSRLRFGDTKMKKSLLKLAWMDAALSNESVSDPTLLSENLTRLQLILRCGLNTTRSTRMKNFSHRKNKWILYRDSTIHHSRRSRNDTSLTTEQKAKVKLLTHELKITHPQLLKTWVGQLALLGTLLSEEQLSEMLAKL
jgi:hypothetical protein